eukprot:NODE_2190_length_2270_cov_3.076062.p1 GENE.NODE_2190_length_2270_cov_3.076062~~NODE_2190_length_2270_cov_3.076062.p1  ORF type:complete len:360 (-),score=111.99 NODE_2190_length_2270_cov_3.076062:819-1898(-)
MPWLGGAAAGFPDMDLTRPAGWPIDMTSLQGEQMQQSQPGQLQQPQLHTQPAAPPIVAPAAKRSAAAASAAAGVGISAGAGGACADMSGPRSHAHLHPQSHPFAHMLLPGGAEGGSVAAEGDTTGVAVLRLRGLPFSVTVQDVLAFFATHDVADRIAENPQAAQLLPKANGRPSGQAVVQMRSRHDAEVAQRALCNQWVGGRYIEVFVYGDEDDTQPLLQPSQCLDLASQLSLRPAGWVGMGVGGTALPAGLAEAAGAALPPASLGPWAHSMWPGWGPSMVPPPAVPGTTPMPLGANGATPLWPESSSAEAIAAASDSALSALVGFLYREGLPDQAAVAAATQWHVAGGQLPPQSRGAG